MDHFMILLVVLVFVCSVHICEPFTVISSETGALVDGPQTGFSMSHNGARTDAREQDAVYDIMRATGNDWATEIQDVCRGRWHGIECMPDENNVYHVVSLSFGALSDDTAFPACDPKQSHISPSITKLPHIRTLFFYRCFGSNPQPIPTFLGQLGRTLQILVLRENSHVGAIPNELTYLTHLKVLDLHKNNLNGSIPVSLNLITGLRSLDLSGNRLTGAIPGLSLPLLNVLDLNENHLMESIPSTIGLSCPSLIKLDLSRNRLIDPIPDSVSGLKDLILMDLSYNRLSGPLPKSLKSIKSLQALILKGNQMTSTIPNDSFEGMTNLMILVLSNMYLTGLIPASLGNLPNLRVVHLDGNHFNGSIPTTFAGLRNLNELRLNDNMLTGPIPLEKEMVWRMKGKLKVFNNSGLCCDARSGGYDSSIDLGIGHCERPRPRLTREVLQHFTSNVDLDLSGFADKSDAIVHKSLLLGMLLRFISMSLIFSILREKM